MNTAGLFDFVSVQLSGDLQQLKGLVASGHPDLDPDSRARAFEQLLRIRYYQVKPLLPLDVGSQQAAHGTVRVQGAPNKTYGFGPDSLQERVYCFAFVGDQFVQWAIVAPFTTDEDGVGFASVRCSENGTLGNVPKDTVLRILSMPLVSTAVVQAPGLAGG